LLAAVYLAQLRFPELLRYAGLWSDHPHGWQYFTNGFLSGNWIHLLFNAGGMWVVCSQFARQIRIGFLLLYFTLFSALASFLYLHFLMPPHAWLVGASGGVYALMGFLCWLERRDRVCFFGLRRLSLPFPQAMLLLLGLEFLVATFWIPVLAWPVHVIAFAVSMVTAMTAHAVYALARWLAEHRRCFEPGAFILGKMKAGVVCHPTETEM
jgi:membrane associated rhomboid family serine protease